MKLYGGIASPYVARAVIVARAKGMSLELSDAPGGGIKSPEYLAINPLGKMPALSDGGRHLAESQVICEYLDEVGGGPSLMPTQPMDRAQVRLLCRLVDLYLMKELGVFFRNMNPAQRNAADVDAALDAYRKGMQHIEHFMGGGTYAVGDQLTIADCVMYPSFCLTAAIVPAFGIANQFDGLPKLTLWWQTMQAHPVASAVTREQMEAFRAFMNARRG
jgi:glutathione S-transferase